MRDHSPRQFDTERRQRLRKRLARAANFSLAVAACLLVWSVLDIDGYGPMLMFGCVVIYLVLMERRGRF
jgi:uncharacterized membrane protein